MFWKEVSKENGEKTENSNRIKDGNGRLDWKRCKCEGFGRSIVEFSII